MPRDRPPRRPPPLGFTLIELLMVIASIGVVVAVSVPLGLKYHQSVKATTGAQQVRSLLNLARQLAMDRKGFVCVQLPSPTHLAFIPGTTCSGDPWTGSVSDASGNIALEPGFTVSASSSPVFDYLGRATPATVYTITSDATGFALTISVATSGRISIP